VVCRTNKTKNKYKGYIGLSTGACASVGAYIAADAACDDDTDEDVRRARAATGSGGGYGHCERVELQQANVHTPGTGTAALVGAPNSEPLYAFELHYAVFTAKYVLGWLCVGRWASVTIDHVLAPDLCLCCGGGDGGGGGAQEPEGRSRNDCFEVRIGRRARSVGVSDPKRAQNRQSRAFAVAQLQQSAVRRVGGGRRRWRWRWRRRRSLAPKLRLRHTPRSAGASAHSHFGHH
jgi:hypothetical protein